MDNQSNVREFAKQGNPKAIAALINHNLKSAKIRVKHLKIKDKCLYIALEGEKIEPKERIISFMEKFLPRLSIESVEKTRILASKFGSNEVVWRKQISLPSKQEVRQEVETKPEVKTQIKETKDTDSSLLSSSNLVSATYQSTKPRYTSRQTHIKTAPKASKSDGYINFKDSFDPITIFIAILYSPFWVFLLSVLFLSPSAVPSLFLFTFYFGTSAITAYVAYSRKRNMVRWFCFNLFPGFSLFGIPLLLLVEEISNKSLPGNVIESKRITWKVSSTSGRIKFLEQCLEYCFIRTLDPSPDYYYFHIPIQIHGLFRDSYTKLPRVYIDLIYFSLIDGEFNQSQKTITYDLKELYEIFWDTFQGKTPIMYVSMGQNNLILLNESDFRVEQLKSLRKISDELEQVKKDSSNLKEEISKTKALIQTLEISDIYKDKVNLYQKGLKLLEKSKMKADFVIQEYQKFLKEYILNFYIADLEPELFKVQDKSINWMGRYEIFKDDYLMLKTMMQEYEKLKRGDYFADEYE